MEKLDSSVLRSIRAQGAYARSVLDAIPQRAALLSKISAFTGSTALIQGYERYGDRAFYEERSAGSDNFDLVVNDNRGKRKLVDMASWRIAHGRKSYAIDYFLASPDGSKVAVGISQGGSEAVSIYVLDTLSGRQIAGPVDRADAGLGISAWSSDSRTLYFPRQKKLAPGDSDSEKYRDLTLVAWNLISKPVAILGSTAGRGPSIQPEEVPTLGIWPNASKAIAISTNGMQTELALWSAPASNLSQSSVTWSPLATRADDVTAVESAGDTIYLLSHENAPGFKVLALNARQALAEATVVVPASQERVIDSIHAASDALYVLARHVAYSVLIRVPHGSTVTEEITLPFKGHVQEAFTDPRQPGITINLQSFVVPPRAFSYDPATHHFADLRLTNSRDSSDRFEISDLEARAEDGVMVPDTLVRPSHAKGPQVVVIQAYGAYGISQLPDFSPRAASLLEAGGTYASCHVRGGGELGDSWRLGGKDANAPHTWGDLIACGEDLIARGYTTKEKLFIFGGSAGGTTVGRALTERPDLFAGAIALVPAVNALRDEFTATGQVNIPEAGSITTQEGFRNLYAEDVIQHVHPGVQYPPVLIAAGLNDPRTPVWEPAKLAAALQASDMARPVLLRIDADAGHGFESTKSQNDALYTDMWAFVFWRAGIPAWRPEF